MASQSKSRAGSKSGMSAGSKSSSSRSTPAKRGFARNESRKTAPDRQHGWQSGS